MSDPAARAAIRPAALDLPLPGGGQRRWAVLAMIVVAAISGSINKQIFPLIVEPLKAELTLSDAQIGILTGLAPGLFAGVATLGLGWLADRMARQWLLAICVLVWSAATLVMGLATTFAGLVVGAFVLSMGEMALLPVFNSVVPDLFGQSLRRRINLAYGAVIVASAGAMLALAGAGLTFLAEHRDALPEVLRNLSTWRVAFVLTAALGLPLALGILWAGPVPRTGSAIAKEPAASFFQRHLRATLGLYAAVCLFGIGSSAVLSWTTIYMMRRFTLGPAELGAGVGGVLLASAILGILVSGIALKRLERSDPHTAPLKLYIAAFLLSIVPGALLLVVDSLTLAYVLMAAQFTLIFAAMAHNFSLVQELSPANARGQASGLFALSAGVVPAFAPLLVGLISDRLGTGAEGLMLAIMGVSIPAYLLGALVLRSRSLGYADVIRDANEPATPV